MLYCPGNNTYSPVSTASTTTTATGDCTCPCCGSSYVIVRVSEGSGFCFDPPPIIPRDLPVWPRPLSDLRPRLVHAVPRTGFNRPGRELRHRGSFRNFHK